MTRRRVRFHLGIVLVALVCAGPLATSADAQMTRFISDMNWVSETNGWGTAERDRSNGELSSSDGGPLTIDGVSYIKGLGAHAYSEIHIQLGRTCTAFNAVV